MGKLDLAVIGNSSFSALIDDKARINWACLPRFDGDPVFCSLLNSKNNGEGGFYDIHLVDYERSEQRYRPNTAIVETVLHDIHGGSVEVVDFAPRFKQFDRAFRPLMIIRRVRPLSGSPKIQVRLRLQYDYGATEPTVEYGSNHIRYIGSEQSLRLTTNAPISFVKQEIPFLIDRPKDFILGPDESLAHSIEDLGREFLEKTEQYWREWSRYLALPFEWQDAVIRAAITLKISSFEDTGAIIAAMTTSIPEAEGSSRTWDYRYCWLRDSYFVVRALNMLGVTRTMEGYQHYITNLISSSKNGYLQPVFGIAQEQNIDERIIDSLCGFDGTGPVRVGNDAYKQVQNDSYGAIILSCAQSFFDARLDRPGDIGLFENLERLGEQAVKCWNQPDAGVWEYRTRQRVHTFSSVMCWAACDRLSIIASKLILGDRARYWKEHADRIHDGIMAEAWNPRLDSFVDSFGGEEPDASLLMMPQLGFINPKSEQFLGTLAFIEKKLRRGNYMFRYAAADDFGLPETSFNVCTFWYIDALAAVGRKAEARELFEFMLDKRNSVGLLSEDIDTRTGELWGNFPQTYSMVGLIHSAKNLSRSWKELF